MASCDDLFQRYYGKIKLTSSKRKNLKNSRESLRDRIRNYFKEKRKEPIPLFRGQGSYYMNTIVNPLEGNEYDIDDGVYLKNLDEDKSKWPSAVTAHNWILEAVDGHTSKKPVDKRTCVRVLYKEDEGFHVDLPIYGMIPSTAYLAEKGQSEWPESDPKAMIDWFSDKVSSKTEQLRKLVCYFKAWGDYHRGVMLNGISFTVLVSDQIQNDKNDDVSLINTAKNMTEYLRQNKTIIKPVTPNENLIEEWTEEDLNKFLSKLDKFIEDGEAALETDDKEEASLFWIGQFGKRFPKFNPPDDGNGSAGVAPIVVIKKEWKTKEQSSLGGNPKG